MRRRVSHHMAPHRREGSDAVWQSGQHFLAAESTRKNTIGRCPASRGCHEPNEPQSLDGFARASQSPCCNGSDTASLDSGRFLGLDDDEAGYHATSTPSRLRASPRDALESRLPPRGARQLHLDALVVLFEPGLSQSPAGSQQTTGSFCSTRPIPCPRRDH
ncbi:hypothetical protein G7046_g8023 [Stylonectria norvegica]|nr:hypothetical protein G7046_g8023 [Stylonectria norvegica]